MLKCLIIEVLRLSQLRMSECPSPQTWLWLDETLHFVILVDTQTSDDINVLGEVDLTIEETDFHLTICQKH